MDESGPINRYAEPVLYPWGRIVVFILSLVAIEVVYSVVESRFTLQATGVDALVGVILSGFLIWLIYNLNLKLLHTVILVWLNLFIVRSFNNILEGYFFTDVFPGISSVIEAMLLSAAFAALSAFAVSLIFLQPRPNESLAANLKKLFSRASNVSWAVRIIAAGPLYFAVYFVFGMMVAPFVTQYYSDPSLGLKIPSFAVMIPVELARGIIFGLVLLPLLASLRFGKMSKFLALSMMLFIPGAAIPLMQSQLPAVIVPYHAVELLADSLVFGYILTRLFSPATKAINAQAVK